ncbi:hypothetical protein GGR51DRAFT_574478 [Nemania sp. FL0031]|nr:hypothetical protein GGR51DRAFT_574478 [Nemania sp. FL0031]
MDPIDPIRQLGRAVAAQFVSNHPNFTTLQFAGLGRHGGAIIFQEQESPKQRARKMVIKYSFGALTLDKYSDADEDLRNEYVCLLMLRGTEHIVQLIPLADQVIRIPGTSDGSGSNPNPGERRCPIFAVEFLQWGTLHTFRQRLLEGGVQRLPSRLLWRIWLCMVRQCVAMAFPPNHPEDEWNIPIKRDVIRLMPYSTLTQNSGHHHNFMFNDAIDPQDPEHEPGLPTLKLIDFGRGAVMDEARCIESVPQAPDEVGSRINLHSAANAFIDMCCLTAGEDELRYTRQPYRYYWRVSGRVNSLETKAPLVFSRNQHLDPDLRTMIMKIVRGRYRQITPLREVLNDTVRAVLDRGPDDPRLRPEAWWDWDPRSETNEAIREIMQRYIYDPPEP